MMSIPRAAKKRSTGRNTAIGETALAQGPGRAPRRPGFTLIEMVIVFTLIAILVGLGLPQYRGASLSAREAVLKEDLFQFRKLIDQYYVDKHKYPASLKALVEDGYLREIPRDPITKSAETWTEVKEEVNADNLTPGFVPGVVDVHSGSEAKASDGTIYNTW